MSLGVLVTIVAGVYVLAATGLILHHRRKAREEKADARSLRFSHYRRYQR